VAVGFNVAYKKVATLPILIIPNLT